MRAAKTRSRSSSSARGDCGIHLHCYAAGRLMFKVKGSDSKFGALRAPRNQIFK